MRSVMIGLCLAVTILVVGCSEKASETVRVDLTEFAITPSMSEVKAGSVKFTAQNRSTSMIHEMVVLRMDGGDREPLAEIEDLAIGKTESKTVTLKAGTYELACLIAPGEAGSTVDHYQQGMRTTFVVK